MATTTSARSMRLLPKLSRRAKVSAAAGIVSGLSVQIAMFLSVGAAHGAAAGASAGTAGIFVATSVSVLIYNAEEIARSVAERPSDSH